jgi:hypothetical protein
MPALTEHESTKLVKLLILGNSGSGKTSSLASLAAAGYRLFICDFDNGLDILLDPKVLAPEHRSNVFYKPLQDRPVKVGDKLVPRATAWQDFMKALGDWKEGTQSMGNFTTWTDRDVLVVDSLTFATQRAFDDALQIGGRLGQRAQIQDYGAAMESIEAMLEMLYGSTCKCNVVMTAHLMFIGDEMSGVRKAYPNVLGQKLAPKIPRMFNNVILAEKKVVGNTVNRRFLTVGTHLVDLKTSKPGSIPQEVEPDLAKLFAVLRGEANY